jgi:hypothetical protein
MTAKRQSPIKFHDEPAESEFQDGFEVILTYRNESKDNALIDLSHRSKWDVQNTDLELIESSVLKIPPSPEESIYQNGLLINRLNETQLTIWNVEGEKPAWPDWPFLTEITDGQVLIALHGASALSIFEKVSALDLRAPCRKGPFVLQGPVVHVPAQVAFLAQSCLLLGFPRGYGQSVAEALLDAGAEYSLKPAGEKVFRDCLAKRFS